MNILLLSPFSSKLHPCMYLQLSPPLKQWPQSQQSYWSLLTSPLNPSQSQISPFSQTHFHHFCLVADFACYFWWNHFSSALRESLPNPWTSSSSLYQLNSSSNQTFHISSNRLAHNSTNDSWVHVWVHLHLDYWKYVLVFSLQFFYSHEQCISFL